jgi:hypothetical protein
MPDKPANDRKLTPAEEQVLEYMKQYHPDLHRAYEDGRITLSTTRHHELHAPVVTAHSREFVTPPPSLTLNDRLRQRQRRRANERDNERER